MVLKRPIMMCKESQTNNFRRVVLASTMAAAVVLLTSQFLAVPLFSSFAQSSSSISTSTIASARTLTSPTPRADAEFGFSVSINGGIAAVSSHGEVYTFYASTGKVIATLNAPPSAGDFGASVSISGDFVVVGAPAYSSLANGGHAYIFNAISGKLIKTLSSPNSQRGGEFGFSVGISGNVVIVGAPSEYPSHAYIFYGLQAIKLVRTLSSPNPQESEGGEFGASVAINGDNVVVSSPNSQSSGAAYVFNVVTGKLVRALIEPYRGGAVGGPVAISGNIVVIGADSDFVGGYAQAGQVYVYEISTGALTKTLTSPNVQAHSFFGVSVALSGNTIVVGAYRESAKSYEDAGRVYAFSATTGNLIATFTSLNPQYLGQLGYSVAVSGNIVVAGAVGETASGLYFAGHAYLFSV
jgi:hypothetical protein